MAYSVPLRRSSSVLVLVCLALIVLVDVFFYDHPIGWTAAAYLALLVGAVALTGPAWRRGRATLVLAALLLGLAVAMLEQPGPIEVVLAALMLLALALTARVGWTASVAAWLRRGLDFAVRAFWQPWHDQRVRHRWRQRSPHAHNLARTLAGWLIPLAFGLVFVGMFWLANPVIDRWMSEVRGWLEQWQTLWREFFALGRLTLWVLVGIGAWALLRVRPRRRRETWHADADAALPPAPRAIDALITPGLVVRCLVLFNALFLVQTVLDVRYLFGGAALPEGMSYAEYAHRGAYPLIATALLAGAFVLVTFRPGGPAVRSAAARRLVYLWIAQNVFLVGTAAWRLGLYVDAYSLSRWRVAAAVWMALVAVGLVSVVWRIVRGRSNAWLLRTNLVAAAAVLYVCAFVNFDSAIAWYNVTHCHEVGGHGAPIDVAYLEHLGPESLPALAWLAERVERSDAVTLAATRAQRRDLHTLRTTVRSAAERLRHDLDAQLADWRGWTWRRARLAGR